MTTQRPSFHANFNCDRCEIYNNDNGLTSSARLIAEGEAPKLPGTLQTGEKSFVRWAVDQYNAEITETKTTYPEAGISAVRQATTIYNGGDQPLLVDNLSSVLVSHIGEGGPRWYQKRFRLYYAQSCWQGEGQWTSDYVENLGVYGTYNHGNQGTFRLASIGSWTTGHLYPLMVLVDEAEGDAWYFEIHSPASWYMEVNAEGYQDNSYLCVYLSAAYEKNDGWFVNLAPGQSYTTRTAVWGRVKGGFEEAIAELTAYKRLTYRTEFPDGVVPVCFNDYMNCLWAQPTRDRLLPLIKSAAEAGCEVFCIDAGWFGNGGKNAWHETLGDWIAEDRLFGEGGLQGIVDEIKAHGMKPGVWLEIETVHMMSEFAKAHPEAILRCHGHPIGNPTSSMDFRRPVVREHLMKVFDRLYDMGVRFVKNDYNHTVGHMCDSLDGKTCSVVEMRAHTKAFLSFVEEVIKTHPGLMIENCGSGAMRCDHATLSRFHVQSTSDQEYYDRYPSIIQGMVACMPPERAGIWSYPYPIDFHQMPVYGEVLPIPEQKYLDTISDPWQTAFNMVNGMMGCFYMSGRPPYADEAGKALIKTAVDLYKKNRTALMSAVPVYPLGLSRMDDTGYTALGLLNKAEGKFLLAVWRMRSDDPSVTVDLSKYLTDKALLSVTYPALEGFNTVLDDGKLTLTFPAGNEYNKGNCAAYLEISI
ncbi:MAG: alpha-galactosidase [Clostridia bacterium]|nr:alpha-galactosidase [Clostridia bacterium]